MLNQKRKEFAEFSKLHNKSDRHIDYPTKDIQPSVINRARLTLFNLTDIWKSKIEANKINKSCDSITANRKALDALNVWTRHRRLVAAEKKSTAATAYFSDENDYYEPIASTLNRKNKHKSHYDSNDRTTNKQKHKRVPDDRYIQLSRIYQNSKICERRKSFDAGINQFDDIDDYIDDSQMELVTNRQRRRSWDHLPYDDPINNYRNGKHSMDFGKKEKSKEKHQTTVVKARMKFKKIKTSDDLYANMTLKNKPIKVLNRQSSVVPIITINDCDKDLDKVNERFIENKEKPRKKLSFREPVVLSEKLAKYRQSAIVPATGKSNDVESNKMIEPNDLALLSNNEVFFIFFSVFVFCLFIRFNRLPSVLLNSYCIVM